MLRIQSLCLLVLSIVGLIPGIEIDSWYHNTISMTLHGILKFYVVYAILLNVFLFLVPQKKLYRHQIVTAILLSFTLVAEFIILVALSFMISNGKSTGYKSNIADFNTTCSTIYLFIIGLVALLTTCYNIFWIRKKISEGFSEQRATANYFAFNKGINSGSVWVIFGAVSVVGIFFTNSLFVLGLVLGLIFVLSFPRLLIEIGYLVYLKIVDKDYWEEMREQKAAPLKNRLLILLKKKSMYGWVGGLILIVMVKIDEKYDLSRTTKNIFGFITILIFVEFAVLLILWLKKVKNNTGSLKK